MGRCKCGCGGNLPLGCAGVSSRAVFVASCLPGLYHLADCIDQRGLDSTSLRLFIDWGESLSSSILSSCHDPTHSRVMPGPREVSDWKSQAIGLCRDLKRIDPQWCRSWTGPSKKGPLVNR